jgi:hypothetical protein
MKTPINNQELVEEFFQTIPDSLLVKLALHDWVALKKICIALTLDLQIMDEERKKKALN